MTGFRIIPEHQVPTPYRTHGDPDAGKRKTTGQHPNQRRRFPCFSFSGKGQRYIPSALAKADDPIAAQAALILMSTDALIRASGVKSPIPTRGPLATYAASPDPDLQAEVERQYGRSLIDPSRFDNKYLRLYLERLAPFATAHSSASNVAPVSPRLAPYLLGGMTMIGVEELCHRALEVLDVFTPEVDPTLSDSMAAVGFGQYAQHAHHDNVRAETFNWRLEEDHDVYLRRREGHTYRDFEKVTRCLSVRQHFLVHDMPRTGSFASLLLGGVGAYKGAEQQSIGRIKADVLCEVADLFNGPTDFGMTEFMYKHLVGDSTTRYRNAIAFDDEQFSRAVARVYERPWAELDFHADFRHLPDDVEVMIARRLIARLSTGRRAGKEPVRMSSVVLLGLALLTGIPLGKWVAFAVQDLDRRGETFITEQTLDEVIEMLEMSEVGMKAGACIAEIRDYKIQLRNIESPYKSRFAWKLRRGSRPFWSAMTYGSESYYLKGYGKHDVPQYKFSFDPYLERD